MNTLIKTSMAVALAGALSLAVIAPSEARSGRGWAAAGAGFAAGAIIGAAAANANNYYGPSYYAPAPSYYAPAPVYTEGYASEPDYYEPAPTYYRPAYRGNVSSPNYNPYVCSTDEGYGRRGSCDSR